MKLKDHPRQVEIVRDFLNNRPLREMEAEYGPSRSTLSRWKRAMPKEAAEPVVKPPPEVEQMARATGRESELAVQSTAQVIMNEMDRQTEYAHKIQEACDEWLSDPKHPDKYTMDPRAEEVDVVYQVRVGDKLVRKKERLADILQRLEGEGMCDVQFHSRVSDPRKLMLDSSNAMSKLMTVASEVADQMRESVQRAEREDEMDAVIKVILQVADEYPGLREKVEAAIERSA